MIAGIGIIFLLFLGIFIVIAGFLLIISAMDCLCDSENSGIVFIMMSQCVAVIYFTCYLSTFYVGMTA